MNNELADLIMQKKAIEAKIKALKNNASIYGAAKVDVEHYPTQRPDRHFLAIYYKPLNGGRPKWQTIFSSEDRERVIAAIPYIAENLEQLYKNLTEENAE